MTGPGSASKPRPHPHANAAFAPPLQNSPPFNNGFQPRGTTVGMQSSAAPQATSSSFNPFAIVSNAEVVGDKIAPVPKPVKLSDRNAILNSREKYEVFYKLSVISGITKEEILREIQACPEREMSEDVILYRIISRKDPEAVSVLSNDTALFPYFYHVLFPRSFSRLNRFMWLPPRRPKKMRSWIEPFWKVKRSEITFK